MKCERCRELEELSRRRPRTDAEGRRLATVHSLFRGNAVVPMLRLTGQWLAEAGFAQGQKLAIEARPKELIIRTV